MFSLPLERKVRSLNLLDESENQHLDEDVGCVDSGENSLNGVLAGFALVVRLDGGNFGPVLLIADAVRLEDDPVGACGG